MLGYRKWVFLGFLIPGVNPERVRAGMNQSWGTSGIFAFLESFPLEGDTFRRVHCPLHLAFLVEGSLGLGVFLGKNGSQG